MPAHPAFVCASSPMIERFDAIVVPRGAEAEAVRKGVAGHVRVVECAAGAHAADAAATFASGSRIAVMGLCGALDPVLHVGDAVVYERLVMPSPYVFDPAAARVAETLGVRSVAGAGVDRVIFSAAAKRDLRASSGADACDMESPALAALAAERGLTIVVIRVVSDDATRDLPNLDGAYDTAGNLRPIGLATAFVREPVRSAHFVRNALAALRALTGIARDVRVLTAPRPGPV